MLETSSSAETDPTGFVPATGLLPTTLSDVVNAADRLAAAHRSAPLDDPGDPALTEGFDYFVLG